MDEFLLPLSPNKTYSVSIDHSIDTSITIPEGVTLIFQGGKLTGTGKLTGNNTKIVAPICQIFGESLNVEGDWCIDRVYPQWFGAKTVARDFDGNVLNGSIVDSSIAINKAIKFKRTGEVFLPRGEYAIGSTIYVKFGITLCGEKGGKGDGYEGGYVGGDVDGNIATVLCPIKSNTNHIASNVFDKGFMIRVNVDKNSDSWNVKFPIPATVIKDMYMMNRNALTLNGYDRGGLRKLKGIYAAGNIEISNITWERFLQAVATPIIVSDKEYDYSDQRKITGCTFQDWGTQHYLEGETTENAYAFDIAFLGDALVFENNSISDSCENLGLRVSHCGGGNITSNIINARILIESCKGITFNANHTEEIFTLKVINSNISFSNNFFTKGPEPTISIKGDDSTNISTVTFNNDMFLFWDRKTDDNDTDPNRIKTINEYDIKVDNYSSIQLNNTYRYWYVTDVFGRMHTYGVKICKDVENKETREILETDIDNFNNYSYLLSESSEIKTNYVVVNGKYVDNLDSIITYQHDSLHVSNDTTWVGDTAAYNYKTQIIWDSQRKIANSVLDFGNEPISVRQGKGGIFILVYSPNARNCIIRLYRKKTMQSTMQEYVDVPICGTTYLYDNGFSICGFKWKSIPVDSSFEILSQRNEFEKITFEGKNIKCIGTNLPSSGHWEKGDMILCNIQNNVSSYYCVAEGIPGTWRLINNM